MIPTIQQGQFGRILPTGDTDPFFGNVLLLLNGQSTVTTDSSSYNRTLIASADLDSAEQLFGFPTYRIDSGVNEKVYVDDDSFVNIACSNKEWCLEIWSNFGGTGADNRYFRFGAFQFGYNSDGSILGACFSLGGTAYSLVSAAGLCTTGVWYHIRLVRDKTDPTWDYIKLYLDGTLVSTSSQITKSSAVDLFTDFGWLIGYREFATWGHFSNLRFTVDTARDYANFTRPDAPFPVG